MRLMAGRHGYDELSLALLITGLVLSMLGGLTRVYLLETASFVLYALAIWRVFSRQHARRNAENAKYLSLVMGVTAMVRQFFVRVKNYRKFKYFRCPACKARLRLPRKVGEVTMTCGKCRHEFKMKA